MEKGWFTLFQSLCYSRPVFCVSAMKQVCMLPKSILLEKYFLCEKAVCLFSIFLVLHDDMREVASEILAFLLMRKVVAGLKNKNDRKD